MRLWKYLFIIPFLIVAGCETSPAYIDRYTNTKKDDVINRLKVLAAAGDANAQASLGYLYQYGISVPKDEFKALTLFTASAAKGSTAGEDGLGVLYMQGQNVKRDYSKALELFRNASQKGDTRAREDLSMIYANGWGVDVDRKKSDELASDALWHSDTEVGEFFNELHRRIVQKKFYPRAAVERHATGSVSVSFRIRAGRATNIKVIKSSGSDVLDQAFVATMAATSFPPPPPGMLMPNYFIESENFGM